MDGLVDRRWARTKRAAALLLTAGTLALLARWAAPSQGAASGGYSTSGAAGHLPHGASFKRAGSDEEVVGSALLKGELERRASARGRACKGKPSFRFPTVLAGEPRLDAAACRGKRWLLYERSEDFARGSLASQARGLECALAEACLLDRVLILDEGAGCLGGEGAGAAGGAGDEEPGELRATDRFDALVLTGGGKAEWWSEFALSCGARGVLSGREVRLVGAGERTQDLKTQHSTAALLIRDFTEPGTHHWDPCAPPAGGGGAERAAAAALVRPPARVREAAAAALALLGGGGEEETLYWCVVWREADGKGKSRPRDLAPGAILAAMKRAKVPAGGRVFLSFGLDPPGGGAAGELAGALAGAGYVPLTAQGNFTGAVAAAGPGGGGGGGPLRDVRVAMVDDLVARSVGCQKRLVEGPGGGAS